MSFRRGTPSINYCSIHVVVGGVQTRPNQVGLSSPRAGIRPSCPALLKGESAPEPLSSIVLSAGACFCAAESTCRHLLRTQFPRRQAQKTLFSKSMCRQEMLDTLNSWVDGFFRILPNLAVAVAVFLLVWVLAVFARRALKPGPRGVTVETSATCLAAS